MIDFPVPILGFCAYSGTGKTTLLKQLIPILKHAGLSIAVVKHAHHSFDIDHPGKDSYELRQAGADQMLVASRQRIAWVRELNNESREEPVLEDALAVLQSSDLDLVLVEGFKQAAFPKIELYRTKLGKPMMYPLDENIIAIAVDSPLDNSAKLPLQLNLNQPGEIADFILENFLNWPIATSFC
jgi:molybdopterin-guanine dinucleotide biosynthesis protein MobB